MNPRATAALAELEAALLDERNALVSRDTEALGAAGTAKLAALRAAVGTCSGDDDPAMRERIRALDELNRANGALLARRRSEVAWTLRALGLENAAGGYDARGALDGARALRHGRVKAEA